MRQYHNVYDKTDWGPGPWHHEPDKIQWVDDATGLDCLIVRTPLGHLCGYVGIPPEHPWHGFDYDQCIDRGADHDEDDGWHYECTPGGRLDAHGGITYADSCQETSPEESGICHVVEPGRPDDVWWFGFDHAHLGDHSPGMDKFSSADSYKTVDYVRDGCADLARQLVEVSS